MNNDMSAFRLVRGALSDDVWARLERNKDLCTAPSGYFTGVDKGGHPYRDIEAIDGKHQGRIVHLVWSLAAYDEHGGVIRAFLPSEWSGAERAIMVRYERNRGMVA